MVKISSNLHDIWSSNGNFFKLILILILMYDFFVNMEPEAVVTIISIVRIMS